MKIAKIEKNDKVVKAAVAVMLVILAQTSRTAKADIFEPFSSINMNPFVQVHGLPMTRSARTETAGTLGWQFRVDVANHFTSSSSDTEAVMIDGETYRSTLSLRYGITDRLELGIDIPHVRHSGGSLDQFIEKWHHIWGLPNSDRNRHPQDELNFRYGEAAGTSAGIESSVSTLGDITISAGYRLSSTEDRTWTLRAGVKLPTGDADRLTGSEGTDVSAAVHLSQAKLFAREALSFHGSLGVLATGNTRVLDEISEDWITFGSAGIAWHASKRIALKAQLDFHSAAYDSGLEELGDPAMQLVLGGTVRLKDSYYLDLSVAEDILTDRSPDVVFQMGIRSAF